jgi:hypothetical protein
MQTRWGGWEFKPNLTLNYMDGYYEVDLEQIPDSAKMLDWIFQIGTKTWGKDALHDLIMALFDILHPQQNYCSFGRNLKPDVQELLKLYQDKLPVSSKEAAHDN